MSGRPLIELTPQERSLLDSAYPHRNLVERSFLEDLLFESLAELTREHAILFQDGVGERAFAHRIGVIAERRLHALNLVHYYADTEYNRLYGEDKYLPEDACICGNILGRREGHGDKITPDLILHGRGLVERQYDNLIAIEVKLADEKHDDVLYDRCRLLRMSTVENELKTAQNYRYTMFVVLRASRAEGHWKYFDQVHAHPDARSELNDNDNVGYCETFATGKPWSFRAFTRPANS